MKNMFTPENWIEVNLLWIADNELHRTIGLEDAEIKEFRDYQLECINKLREGMNQAKGVLNE